MEPRQHWYKNYHNCLQIFIIAQIFFTAIFVAGYSQVKHNELLQLLLPEKLLAVDKQVHVATICVERGEFVWCTKT